MYRNVLWTNRLFGKTPVNFDAFRASQLWHQLNVHVGLDKKWHDITCEIILEWLSKSLIIIVIDRECFSNIANIGKPKLQKGDDRLVAPPSK